MNENPTIVKYSGGSLREVPLTSVKVNSFLREFLERQRSGLSGNYRKQKYPFDSCLWQGVIKAGFWELDYKGLPRPIPGPNRWWPYEQTGYLLDGLFRLGILTGDQEMVKLFEDNLAYLLDHADNGRLAGKCYGYESEWPMGVFFKGVSAYLDCFDDAGIKAAFQKHYHAVSVEELGNGSRNITNIEGLLSMAKRCDDDDLRTKAFDVYKQFSKSYDPDNPYAGFPLEKMETLSNVVYHGVTLCEEIKLPVMLYLAGGGKRYFDAAQRAWDLTMKNHGSIPGVPGSVEHGFGRDPEFGYESCVLSDALYTLGYFIMAGGNAQYADQAERIAYNAVPGAVTKDFSALQYFSAPNQVVATPFSNLTSFLYGSAPLRQYRPDHFAACCPGNIHRAMPNFISRMWMLSGDDTPAAVCYGPSEFSGNFMGTAYKISENTDYPFEEKIDFKFTVANGGTIPFIFRIPSWCSDAQLLLNGKAITLEYDGFVKISGIADGDTLTLKMPMKVQQCSERHWSHFERGPLVYTLPVKHSTVKEDPEERFTPLSMKPQSAWNYAVAPGSPCKAVETGNTGAYPYDEPPMVLEVAAKKISGAFAELDQERYTPRVPLFCQTAAETETLRLVPMGATETRLTAFPDGIKRSMLPILSGYTAEGENMEQLDFMAFRDQAREIRIDRDGYFDLANFYRKSQNCSAYLQIRFYSEYEGTGIASVMMSDGGTGWIDGKKVLEIPAIMEAEFAAGLWFEIPVRKGHNHLVLKVDDTIPTYDHRDAWGAKVQFFI
ncbi:MAG: hypothetical protein E7057_09620 [Lentisphaerae bacterium]|nr:hypothetical protein [Lentisphaerota bacterium]